jgi:REP element-mobilizing transposase RayT
VIVRLLRVYVSGWEFVPVFAEKMTARMALIVFESICYRAAVFGTEPRLQLPSRDCKGAMSTMRYFLTFSCYGTHLHGDESGSVDRDHNLPGSRLLEADPHRESAESRKMTQAPYLLGRDSRATVLEALRGVCSHRHWTLLAAHVRTNHVHVVIEAEVRPEKMMNDFKSYVSRALNRLEPDGSDRKRWARHGSTRWLWNDQDARHAVRYVVEEQGEPMAVFVGGEF